jgi:hypothetical protein
MNRPPGLPPTNPDPELLAKYHDRGSFRDRFQGVIIALGLVIALLVVLSIIGALA